MPMLTTVVGSYPVPDWLVALPSEQALVDATAVVLGVQERAGIDLVADGVGGWSTSRPPSWRAPR
ncbi:MAG: hypothetical protein AB1505_18075 [Candidatus Latescibacterota bacterium]